MVTKVQSPVVHPRGASKDLKGMVGGQTFKTVAAFEKKIGKNGEAILPPGQSVKIFVGQMAPGGAFPHITGLNNSSPFTVKFDKGYITIAAKSSAQLGSSDNVKLDHGGPVVRNPPPSVQFPFKLTVGIGHIMMG